jgi:hypothetical protein
LLLRGQHYVEETLIPRPTKNAKPDAIRVGKGELRGRSPDAQEMDVILPLAEKVRGLVDCKQIRGVGEQAAVGVERIANFRDWKIGRRGGCREGHVDDQAF